MIVLIRLGFFFSRICVDECIVRVNCPYKPLASVDDFIYIYIYIYIYLQECTLYVCTFVYMNVYLC